VYEEGDSFEIAPNQPPPVKEDDPFPSQLTGKVVYEEAAESVYFDQPKNPPEPAKMEEKTDVTYEQVQSVILDGSDAPKGDGTNEGSKPAEEDIPKTLPTVPPYVASRVISDPDQGIPKMPNIPVIPVMPEVPDMPIFPDVTNLPSPPQQEEEKYPIYPQSKYQEAPLPPPPPETRLPPPTPEVKLPQRPPETRLPPTPRPEIRPSPPRPEVRPPPSMPSQVPMVSQVQPRPEPMAGKIVFQNPSAGTIFKNNPEYQKVVKEAHKFADYALNEMQFQNAREAKGFVTESLKLLYQLAE